MNFARVKDGIEYMIVDVYVRNGLKKRMNEDAKN